MLTNSGEVQVEIEYLKNSYSWNEDIELLCKIDNRHSKKDLQTVRLKLKRKIVAKCNERKERDYFTSRKVLKELKIKVDGCKHH